MIERTVAKHILEMSGKFPVVTVTGPRQSGKTTLVKSLFKEYKYYNLENPETLAFAKNDPNRFLKNCYEGCIIDEAQNFPEIFSYIQVITDENKRQGQFIVTGSSQFKLMSSISQSLAGRTALVKLLPLSVVELRNSAIIKDTDDTLFSGFYPRIYDKEIYPTEVYGGYFETYVEKDIRQFGQIQNLMLFRKFVKLCAGRTGSVLNLSSIANDTGISHTTAQSWLSMLQAGFIVFLMEPFFANINKRLIKSPKIYFYDVGFASFLMGIENKKQIETHPLRGNLFENMVVMEILKYRFNRGKLENINFYRDSNGNEVDVLYKIAQHVLPVEIKSGETITRDYFKGLNNFDNVIDEFPYGKALIYAGKEERVQNGIEILNYSNIERFFEKQVGAERL